MKARPRGATPPKPANQGSMKGAHVQKPATSGRPTDREPAKATMKTTGIHKSGTRGTGRGAR